MLWPRSGLTAYNKSRWSGVALNSRSGRGASQRPSTIRTPVAAPTRRQRRRSRSPSPLRGESPAARRRARLVAAISRRADPAGDVFQALRRHLGVADIQAGCLTAKRRPPSPDGCDSACAGVSQRSRYWRRPSPSRTNSEARPPVDRCQRLLHQIQRRAVPSKATASRGNGVLVSGLCGWLAASGAWSKEVGATRLARETLAPTGLAQWRAPDCADERGPRRRGTGPAASSLAAPWAAGCRTAPAPSTHLSLLTPSVKWLASAQRRRQEGLPQVCRFVASSRRLMDTAAAPARWTQRTA